MHCTVALIHQGLSINPFANKGRAFAQIPANALPRQRRDDHGQGADATSTAFAICGIGRWDVQRKTAPQGLWGSSAGGFVTPCASTLKIPNFRSGFLERIQRIARRQDDCILYRNFMDLALATGSLGREDRTELISLQYPYLA
jgi:hypothetical protein